MKKANSGSSQRPGKRFPTIGVCGLDCGLCPRYYTVGPSRCPGCAGPRFFDKHPSCSFITCCVKEKRLEVCAECRDFSCSKFKSEEEYSQLKGSSSYPPCARIMPNMKFIREHGINEFMKQQKMRMAMLEKMIERFDDGRSRSFYCRAAALLDATSLGSAIAAADRKIRTDRVKQDDRKTKAKILKTTLGPLLPCEARSTTAG
jgi:hypothetical protein